MGRKGSPSTFSNGKSPLHPSSNKGRMERISNSQSFPLVPKNEPTSSAVPTQQNVRPSCSYNDFSGMDEQVWIPSVSKSPPKQADRQLGTNNNIIQRPAIESASNAGLTTASANNEGNNSGVKRTLSLVPKERLLSCYQHPTNKPENQQVVHPPFAASVPIENFGQPMGLPKLVRSTFKPKPIVTQSLSDVCQPKETPALVHFDRSRAIQGQYSHWNSSQGNSLRYGMGQATSEMNPPPPLGLLGSGSGAAHRNSYFNVTSASFDFSPPSFPHNHHQPIANTFFHHSNQGFVSPPFAKPPWMTQSASVQSIKQEVQSPDNNLLPPFQRGLDVFQRLSNVVKQESSGQLDFSQDPGSQLSASNPFETPFKGIIKIEIEDTLF